jgi:hypothetical protein
MTLINGSERRSNMAFPTKLFVHEKFGGDENYDAYPQWEDAEPTDVVAEYQLIRVVKVCEKREKYLEEVPNL